MSERTEKTPERKTRPIVSIDELAVALALALALLVWAGAIRHVPW